LNGILQRSDSTSLSRPPLEYAGPSTSSSTRQPTGGCSSS
jgi:hypothetical protein